ncbi:MAG: hypothetical protein ABI400_14850, partial [Lacisediminihabitans sp.]
MESRGFKRSGKYDRFRRGILAAISALALVVGGLVPIASTPTNSALADTLPPSATPISVSLSTDTTTFDAGQSVTLA